MSEDVATANEFEAVRWWRHATKQGDASAIARLDGHIANRKWVGLFLFGRVR